MAKTLLNSVNELLKRVNVIAGDAGALSALTDSSRQHPIDIAVQVINEGIDELYLTMGVQVPLGQAEATITLATGDRSYALASGLVRMLWPLIDKTNNQYIGKYPGGYNEILMNDPEQDDTGLPHYAAISPVTGELYLDCAPTSAENGRVYTYQYEKNLVVSSASDTVPFNDVAFRAMVPAWVQLYKREMRNEFDSDLFKASIGRAARAAIEVKQRDSYSPRR